MARSHSLKKKIISDVLHNSVVGIALHSLLFWYCITRSLHEKGSYGLLVSFFIRQLWEILKIDTSVMVLIKGLWPIPKSEGHSHSLNDFRDERTTMPTRREPSIVDYPVFTHLEVQDKWLRHSLSHTHTHTHSKEKQAWTRKHDSEHGFVLVYAMCMYVLSWVSPF